jgi:aldose sugar dehydrogenase
VPARVNDTAVAAKKNNTGCRWMVTFIIKNSSYICIVFLLGVFNSVTGITLVRSNNASFQVEQLASGLNVPWGLAFLSSNHLLITQKNGSVSLLNLTKQKLTPIKKSPKVMANGQGGMLDVAISPQYKQDKWIYFTYVKNREGEGVTTLARAQLQNNSLAELAFTAWQDLLVTRSNTNTDYHFGSRIAFDTTGHVYFGVGDRGVRPNAQDLTNHAGSIIRLKLNGDIPEDNPFTNTNNALAEIWSYGHRNPQGLAYDIKNQRLWEIEHGPRGGDELNLIVAGKNYGWPVISYGKEYWGPVSVGEGTHKKGMQQPIKTYIPSIAPGSLLHYTGDAFPQWQGNLFAGALKLQHINRIVLDKNARAIKEERLLENMHERIRALAQSPEGWIVFSTDRGNIYRIKPVD